MSHSAEAVSQMVIADLKQEKWEQPEWLPTNYLTAKHSSVSYEINRTVA